MPDTTLTSAELDELERLAKAATPGPWKAETNEKAANVTILGRSADKGRTRASDGHAYLLTVDCSDGIDDGAYAPMMAEHVANAAFIAFANPATILALLSLARAGLEAGKAEESMRERAATCAADTLNAWAADLYATFEGYVEAKTSGLHAGRRIDAGNADMYAKQFRERAEAVAGSADYVATAIRALPLTGGDKS